MSVPAGLLGGHFAGLMQERQRLLSQAAALQNAQQAIDIQAQQAQRMSVASTSVMSPLRQGLQFVRRKSYGHYEPLQKRLIERSASAWYRNHYGVKPWLHWCHSGIVPSGKGWIGCEWSNEAIHSAHLYRHRVMVLMARPLVVRTDERGFWHSRTGPAVLWPSGRREYYLHDRKVPRWMVEHPEWVPIRKIKKESNAEVRRLLIDAYIERHGHKRFIERYGAKLVHEDDVGKLWGVPGRVVGYSMTLAEVLNKTPEPGGTFRTYFIPTPPHMRTCREAIAWTFGMSEDEYRLTAES